MDTTEKPELQIVPALPEKLVDGRDELNFAEFPLGTIAERVDSGTKTLVFEDQVYDKRRNELITRKLTITGSDAHGLPTSTDDEVLLGLVQLAKLQRFQGPKVYFSRYQLLRLLKWPLSGQSYARLDQALNRWVGVTLYYENAWRDKENSSWVDEKFHILERVKIYRDENESTRPKPNPDQGSFEFASSFFVWNEVVYRSFTTGNLKALDFDFVLGLKSSITRRLYRFLDKRFFLADTIEMDLKSLAYEHVGLSRNTPTGDIKRKLAVAIDELVDKGFLRPLPKEKRFIKVKAGQWRVHFEKPAAAKALADPRQPELAPTSINEPRSAGEELLVSRGVSAARARQLAATYPETLIREKIEVLDHLVSKRDKAVSSNPAGFLIRSIEQRFDSPRDFESTDAKKARAEARAKRAAATAARERRREERETAKEREKNAAVAKFWEQLTPETRDRFEQEALAKAKPFQKDIMAKGGVLGRVARDTVLADFALAKLAEG